MSLAERGFYGELLDHCHTEGSVPDDPILLARMCAVSLKEAKRPLPKVRAQFVKEGDRLVNPKAAEVRARLFAYHERQQTSGTAGANKRCSNRSTTSTRIPAAPPKHPLEIELIIAKQRNGPRGIVPLKFRRFAKFFEPDDAVRVSRQTNFGDVA